MATTDVKFNALLSKARMRLSDAKGSVGKIRSEVGYNLKDFFLHYNQAKELWGKNSFLQESHPNFDYTFFGLTKEEFITFEFTFANEMALVVSAEYTQKSQFPSVYPDLSDDLKNLNVLIKKANDLKRKYKHIKEAPFFQNSL